MIAISHERFQHWHLRMGMKSPEDHGQKKHSQTVPKEWLGVRLDQAAASLFPDFSRARLQTWIKDGLLRVNGAEAKPKLKLLGGELLDLTPEPSVEGDWLPEAIDLAIVYEDEHLLVVNKPANLVVHPAAGNPQGTLLNGLIHHDAELLGLPRGGIVHRLDKDTTGLMVVAKTLPAHHSLVAQLQARTVGREYVAVVHGVVKQAGLVEAPLGRHPQQRQKMAVVSQGKHAVTHFQVEERFAHHTLLALRLETGRTHQIRVHMTHLGYPLVGDQTYGGRQRKIQGASPELLEALVNFPRQALHARRLSLLHPESNEPMRWEVPLPNDLVGLLAVLRTEDNPR